jgi:hypothetical protein
VFANHVRFPRYQPGGDRHWVRAPPRIPDWPGSESYTGELLHSAAYRTPAPYVGKCVLVVGAGSSAMEIAHDVATGGAAKVWLAVRTTPNIMLRALPGGFPSDFIASPLYDAPVWFADAIAELGRRISIGDQREGAVPQPFRYLHEVDTRRER